MSQYSGVVPASSRPHRRADVTVAKLIGGKEKRDLVVVASDPTWPQTYRHHERRISAALGLNTAAIEHIGSTSVPALAAKPIIDILIVVNDITAEEDYLPQLVEAGYVLRVREPGHRLVRTPQLDVHVHILETGDPRIDEYLLLRDHLRRDETDRDLYARTKYRLSAQDWPDMNAYADAKTEVIAQIKERARRSQ